MTPLAGRGEMFSKPVGNKIQTGKEANSKGKGRKIQELSFRGSRLFRALSQESRDRGTRDPFDPRPAIKQGVRVKQRRRLRVLVSSAPKFQLWRRRRIAKSSDYRKQLFFFRPQRTICGFG
jgi:hypothetical protein